ncbi:MAG: hypothetical protein ACRD3D_12685 [Terriglobia bacterium]
MLFLLMPGRALAASRSQADLTPITMTARDSTGTVWGVGPGPGGLYRWSGDHWSAVSGGTRETGFASGAWPGPDGGVIIVWQQGPSATVTWRRGGESNVLGDFDGTLRNRWIFATEHNGVWLTANSASIYHLASDGHFRAVYTLQPDQFFPYRNPLGRGTFYWPFLATPDGQGRTWFWGKALSQLSNRAPLEGFLIYDGHSFEYHRTIPGLPDHPMEFLGSDDATHLWAGVLGHGLYSINTTTLTAAPVPEPEAGAFEHVLQVFQAGSDTYVVTAPARPAEVETLEHRYTAMLWRYANGQWIKVLNGIDDLPERQQDFDRPRLSTPDGLWLGSHSSGVWFIPVRGGAPELVNWRQGFPLDSVDDLYNLGGGKLLALQYRPARSFVADAASLLKPAKPAANVQVVNPFSRLDTDPQFHVWGLLSVSGRALSEWDGEKWIDHPLPGSLNPGWLSGADVDAQGRIWLFPGCIQGLMAIYDPRHSHWTTYGGYQDALEAQAHPVRFFNAADDGMKPVYGARGQVVFMGACYGINYYDGQRWYLWNRPSLPGLPYFWDGPAFFDAAGRLAVDIHHQTWELGAEGAWRRTRYQPEPGPLVRFFVPRPLLSPPPSGCAPDQASSLARDRLGRAWWTWEGSVYMGVPGRCREALSADQSQPFIDGRLLRRALVDQRGGVFLETLLANSRLGEYVVLPPPANCPQITIKLEKLAPDSVRAKFSAAPNSLFVWRIDGNEWSAPQTQDEAVIRSLSAGPHVIEADAIDESVEIAPVPASVTIDIGGNEQQTIAGLVSRLMHETTDDQRQADLDALANQPPADVLRTLQAARPAADAAVRWWIDAAIQQAEDKQAQENKP